MTMNQVINSELSLEKDESLSNQEKFQFVLRGKVRSENDSQFFQLENGEKFKVRAIIASSYPQEKAKDLKISVLGAGKKMKIGQLWSMKLVLKEGFLNIQEAKYIQD